jgi:hypothetical protein
MRKAKAASPTGQQKTNPNTINPIQAGFPE